MMTEHTIRWEPAYLDQVGRGRLRCSCGVGWRGSEGVPAIIAHLRRRDLPPPNPEDRSFVGNRPGTYVRLASGWVREPPAPHRLDNPCALGDCRAPVREETP